MATGGGSPPPPAPLGPFHHRASRWLGQEYADITKLRELSAKHDRLAMRNQQKAARINTKIERLRHVATILREKAQVVLAQIPELEQEIAQYDRDIKSATERTGGGHLTSDVTALHYRVRKLQQKIVDKQHRARALELKAAQRTQKTAELKIKVDRYLEASKTEEQEAQAYRQRADRLQMATEGEVQARLQPGPAADPNAPPPRAAGPQ